jgi:hypothetical protein
MLETEFYLTHPELPFSKRDPNDPLSGWKLIGKGRIVDLPSLWDQICIGPGQAVRARGVMHLADMDTSGQRGEPAVRLIVDFLHGSERLGPIR